MSTRITTVKKRTITEINCSNDCNSSPSSVSFGDIDSYTNLSQTCTTSETHAAMIKHVKNADMSENDKIFFTCEIDTPGKGLQQLVSKSVLNRSGSVVSQAETLYHLDVAKFCNGLNGSQQAHFARIMQQTSNHATFTYTRPPNSMHDIHAFYTRSKTSICNALTAPPIQVTQHHTYITLTSVIDYFLAYGHVPDYITKNDNVERKHDILACKQAMEIRREAFVPSDILENPMILYLLFWSDDFEGSMLR